MIDTYCRPRVAIAVLDTGAPHGAGLKVSNPDRSLYLTNSRGSVLGAKDVVRNKLKTRSAHDNINIIYLVIVFYIHLTVFKQEGKQGWRTRRCQTGQGQAIALSEHFFHCARSKYNHKK